MTANDATAPALNEFMSGVQTVSNNVAQDATVVMDALARFGIGKTNATAPAVGSQSVVEQARAVQAITDAQVNANNTGNGAMLLGMNMTTIAIVGGVVLLLLLSKG